MKINAKYFGEVTYEEEDVVTLTVGLIGFEEYTRYLPLPFHEDDDSLISFQSLENEQLSFIIMNPFRLFPDYDPQPPKKELAELGAEEESDISYYVISVIRDTVAETTVNLKAPLAVNARNRKGKQILLEDAPYTFRHPLSEAKKEGE